MRRRLPARPESAPLGGRQRPIRAIWCVPLEVLGHNRAAWDRQVERGNRRTIPVGPEVIERARRGEWSIVDFARKRGEFRVAHRIPYSDVAGLTPEDRAKFASRGDPLGFGPTLDGLIGGQIAAGFAITGFFEDVSPSIALSGWIPPFIATGASRP